jgi:ADP-heptose:LPS heptosyltransferase
VKILFITSNRIGDCVLSTGLLDHLLAAHGGVRLTIACGPAPAPLFRAVPGLDRVIVMNKGPRKAHWRNLWRETAFHLWDLVVDLRASAFAWIVPTRRRLTFRPSKAPVHRVRQLGALIGRAGAPPAPRLWLDDAARAEGGRLIPSGLPVLGVGPTANWPGKQWPAERFAETIVRLTSEGGFPGNFRVAVFGSPAERAAAEPVLAAIPPERRINVVGSVDLPGVAACLGRCAFFLGNDSGLMHMAAATGIPTLGLFGPSNDAHFAPWGARAAFVRGERSFQEYVDAPGYDYRATSSLMDDLSVDRVVEAAAALWKGCAG